MKEKINDFKNYIEEVSKKNYDDYDAVEYLDGFDCDIYNNAVKKIHTFEKEKGFVSYVFLFTDKEMLDVNIMYACIVCGAIESEMTEKLKKNWIQFTRDFQ